MTLKRTITLLLMTVNMIIGTNAGVTADSPGFALYADLLAAHVRDGRVDYSGFKADEDRLDQYLEILSAIDPATLDRDSQMAYYINAYNAWTIKLILTAYPDVESIKELGSLFRSPWKKKFVKLNGRTVTLDHIEHDILRPKYGDPRVHFAVNCASISCPPLKAEPYNGETLNAQLDTMTVAFINDGKSNYMDGSTLYVSRIFKWFGEDFGNDIAGFFRKYATGPLAEQIEEADEALKVRYLDYDWSLNRV